MAPQPLSVALSHAIAAGGLGKAKARTILGLPSALTAVRAQAQGCDDLDHERDTTLVINAAIPDLIKEK